MSKNNLLAWTFVIMISLIVSLAIINADAQDEKTESPDDIYNIPQELQEEVRNVKIEDINKIEEKIKNLGPVIKENSEKYGVEEALIKAIIAQESGGDINAVSYAGAVGIMQVMPDTGASACSLSLSELKKPENNIECGTRYIKLQLENFDNKIELALAAYNAGPGNVQPNLNEEPRIPDIEETQDYVIRVLRYYIEFGGKGSVPKKDEVTGDFRYAIKSSIRTGIKYDFSQYSKALELAKETKKKIVDCLKSGSGSYNDEDVQACAEANQAQGLRVSGKDGQSSFLIIYETTVDYTPKYIKRKSAPIKFGFLVEDNIAPPLTEVVGVIIHNERGAVINPSWRNLASDVKNYELEYKIDNSPWQKVALPSGNVESIDLGGISEDKGKEVCVRIFAEDEAGNTIKSENGRHVKCEPIKKQQ